MNTFKLEARRLRLICNFLAPRQSEAAARAAAFLLGNSAAHIVRYSAT